MRTLRSRFFRPIVRQRGVILGLCLHVVVALHEVGGLALTVFRVSDVAAGGRAALLELGLFRGAVAGSCDGEYEVPHGCVSIESLHLFLLN